jgi:hypothetical protein
MLILEQQIIKLIFNIKLLVVFLILDSYSVKLTPKLLYKNGTYLLEILLFHHSGVWVCINADGDIKT